MSEENYEPKYIPHEESFGFVYCVSENYRTVFMKRSFLLPAAINFKRVLEKSSFDALASELGMRYKGVAAIYYRAIQKLKRRL